MGIHTKFFLGSFMLLLLSGCINLTERIGNSFTAALMNQPDPEVIKDAVPAYLMMVDALIEASPDNEDTLLTGAKLYGAYSSSFVTDNERQKNMADRSLDYAKRAFCEVLDDSCEFIDKPVNEFLAVVDDEADEDDVKVLYGLAVSWAGWIQANPGDWLAIGQIPKVKALIERVIAIDDEYDDGNAHLYLAVLASQIPPSLGGQPEVGKKHFDRSLEISSGANLMAKVMYAQYYARLVFDQNLHDRLLKEVLAAETKVPGKTLINVLAQKQAKQLLAGSKEFF